MAGILLYGDKQLSINQSKTRGDFERNKGISQYNHNGKAPALGIFTF